MTRLCVVASLAVIACLACFPSPGGCAVALVTILALRHVAERADREADRAAAALDGGPVKTKHPR